MPQSRPGVYVEELSLPNVASAGSRVATAAFIGTSDRGPTIPTRVDSWGDFTSKFGSFTTHDLQYALYHFFGNGGRVAYVTRVVGAGAAASDFDVAGSYGVGASTGANIFTISAKNPGDWGDDLTVTVGALANRDDSFTLTVSLDGVVVESYSNLNMRGADARYVETVLNTSATASRYVSITVNPTVYASVTTGGNDVKFNAVNAQALSGGAAGSAPNSGAWADAVTAQSAVEGPFLLNLVNISDSTIINNALAFAEGRKDVFVIIDPDATASQTGTPASVPSYTQSGFGAAYYPRIVFQDPASVVTGGLRVTAPGGALAGLYITTDAQVGVWRAPAGDSAKIGGAVALEYTPSNAEYDTLNENHINAFRTIAGVGVCAYGVRTLKRNTIDKYITARRTLIFLNKALNDASRFAVFMPNDSNLWDTVESRCRTVVDELWRAGGLKGRSPDQAYYVVCDESNNTETSIQAGIVNIEVGVSLQSPAEFVVIKLGQVAGGATTFTETL
jgi:phage tail sheath protein FI